MADNHLLLSINLGSLIMSFPNNLESITQQWWKLFISCKHSRQLSILLAEDVPASSLQGQMFSKSSGKLQKPQTQYIYHSASRTLDFQLWIWSYIWSSAITSHAEVQKIPLIPAASSLCVTGAHILRSSELLVTQIRISMSGEHKELRWSRSPDRQKSRCQPDCRAVVGTSETAGTNQS